VIEVDMPSIGPFARAFGGPPVKNHKEQIIETVRED
jgi:hypothetical protein